MGLSDNLFGKALLYSIEDWDENAIDIGDLQTKTKIIVCVRGERA
jgi:hypothetical protein